MRRILSALALLALSGASAFAQTAVQQSATQLNAGVSCQVAANPAVNTQNTLTFNVPAGQSFYLTSIELKAAQDAIGGAVSNVRFTTTNLQSLEWDFSQASAASSTFTVAEYANPAGIVKSAVGPLNVTIVSPSAATHTAFPMAACGYFAP